MKSFRRKFCFCIFTAAMSFTDAVPAESGETENQKSESQYRLPDYGMAGCGLGMLIIPPKPNNLGGAPQLSAATINESPSHLHVSSSVASVLNLPAGPSMLGAAVSLASGAASVPFEGGSSQASSIKSQSSGCSGKRTKKEVFARERISYVAINFESLKKEAAQGSGLHLQGFAKVLGCGETSRFSVFAMTSKKFHGEIFSDAVPENVAARWIEKSKTQPATAECM